MPPATATASHNSAYYSAADTWSPGSRPAVNHRRITTNDAKNRKSDNTPYSLGVSEVSHIGPSPVMSKVDKAKARKQDLAPAIMTRRKRWREDPDLQNDASSTPCHHKTCSAAVRAAKSNATAPGLTIDDIFPPAWFDRLPLSNGKPIRLPARNPILSSRRMNPDYDKQHMDNDTDADEAYDLNARLERRNAQESFATFREVHAFVTKPAIPHSLDAAEAQRFRSHSRDVIFREYGAHVKETCRGLGASYSKSHVESADHVAFLVGRVADIEHRPKKTRVGAGSGSSGESGPSGLWQDWYIIGVCALNNLNKREWAAERPDPGAVKLRGRPAPAEFHVMMRGPIAYISVICTVPGFGAEFLDAIEAYYGAAEGRRGGYWGFALEAVPDAYGFYYQHGYRAYDPARGEMYVPLSADYYVNRATKKKRLAAFVSFASNIRDELYRLVKPSAEAVRQAAIQQAHGTAPWMGIM